MSDGNMKIDFDLECGHPAANVETAGGAVKTTKKDQEKKYEDREDTDSREIDNTPDVHENLQKEATEEVPKTLFGTLCEVFKYFYSVVLLAFSVTVVMAAVFTKQTTATGEDGNIPTFVACVVFWFLICWLAMMEGGQGALVGLKPVKKTLYNGSHPRALKCTSLAHKGDNMERFIVGRQFLVVLVVFVINLLASATADASVLNLNDGLAEVFLSSGVAVILTTITLGQLAAQINAAKCMLDFINNYFMVFTTYVSLAIEMSGLLHAVYLVQMFFAAMTGKPVASNEPPRTVLQSVFFWMRIFMSVVILGFAFAVTLKALFSGKTTMYEGVPEVISVILFFLLMCFVGMMEGMQIALFAVVNLPEEELIQHTIAHKNCQLTFKGNNLGAFLIGRQICVTVFMFVVARITTIDVGTDAGEESIFGLGTGIQSFFNTGLLGALITTIVGSLAWRIIASSFPIAFLSNPLIYVIIRTCLILEQSGICSAAWILARIHKVVVNFQDDEIHIGGSSVATNSENDTSSSEKAMDMDISPSTEQ